MILLEVMILFKQEYILSDLYISAKFGCYECHVSNLLYRNQRLHSPYHTHEGVELQLNVNGEVLYKIKGESFSVGSQSYVIIGKNVVHNETIVCSDIHQSYCIAFSLTKHKRNNDNDLADVEANALTDILNNIDYSVGSYDQKTADLLDAILDEIQSQKFGYYMKVQSLLIEILIDIARYCNKSSAQNQKKSTLRTKTSDDSRFEICSNFFNNLYMGLSLDFSIEALKSQLFLSTKQINRLIVKYFGMTFSQKKSVAMLDRSIDLVRSTNIPMYKIGEMCGFPNSKYFSVKFKSYTGYSPSDFRNINSV